VHLLDVFVIINASMPGLARKILIFAAVDGLVLQPLAQRGQRPVSAASIAYSDNSVGPLSRDGGEAERAGESFEAFGIVGAYSSTLVGTKCGPVSGRTTVYT
jgi:hypothetical protein